MYSIEDESIVDVAVVVVDNKKYWYSSKDCVVMIIRKIIMNKINAKT